MTMHRVETHHVVKSPTRPGGWSVWKEGTSRASSTHGTRSEAISSAQRLSRKHGTRLVIHEENGRVKR